MTVDSSPSSSTYGDACDQLSQTEEEEVEEDAGLDSLMFEADTPDEVYQKAMKEPLSELNQQIRRISSELPLVTAAFLSPSLPPPSLPSPPSPPPPFLLPSVQSLRAVWSPVKLYNSSLLGLNNAMEPCIHSSTLGP